MDAPLAPPPPRSGWSRGCLAILGAVALMAFAAGLAAWLAVRAVDRTLDPDPVIVASASLAGLREQNRLSAFAARYVAVVTSRQSRLGLTEQKTLIMPGTVTYEVDLSKLNDGVVKWDAATKKLSVRLPPIQLVGPQVDLNAIREYGGDGLLARVTDAEARLDTANRRAGQAELVRQARGAVPMRLARDAARRAVERSFAMPLRAVGVEASVDAWFPDERPGIGLERWDMTRSIGQVLGNAR